jgi:hypothetical protein
LRSFIRNHARQVFACDFLVQNTALLSAVYIFVVMEVESRRIVHINVTTCRSLAWVEKPVRQATEWGEAPRFLVHDNDGIFGPFRERQRRGHKRLRYRCQLNAWLADATGIEGIPIPYGTPKTGKLIALPVLGGVQHDYRRAA